MTLDYLDNYSDDEDDDENVTRQLQEQYVRTHGLRRHTNVRPDLFVHNEANPIVNSDARFAYQSATIETSLLTNRLHHLQQQKQFDTLITPHNQTHESYSDVQTLFYHQRNPHSTSYNGLFVQSNISATSDNYYEEPNNTNNWLSAPSPDEICK